MSLTVSGPRCHNTRRISSSASVGRGRWFFTGMARFYDDDRSLSTTRVVVDCKKVVTARGGVRVRPMHFSGNKPPSCHEPNRISHTQSTAGERLELAGGAAG